MMRDDGKMSILGKFFQRKPLIIIGVIVLVVATIAILLNSLKKVTYINIYVTPVSATVKIDDKEYANGTYEILPGEHTISVSKDSFVTKERGVSIGAGESYDFFEYLAYPKSCESYSYIAKENEANDCNIVDEFGYYLTDDRDLSILEQIATGDAEIFIDQIHIAKLYYKFLPKAFYGDDGAYLFELNKDESCTTRPCLVITNHDGNEEANLARAKQYLESKGYNTSLYNFSSKHFQAKKGGAN